METDREKEKNKEKEKKSNMQVQIRCQQLYHVVCHEGPREAISPLATRVSYSKAEKFAANALKKQDALNEPAGGPPFLTQV